MQQFVDSTVAKSGRSLEDLHWHDVLTVLQYIVLFGYCILLVVTKTIFVSLQSLFFLLRFRIFLLGVAQTCTETPMDASLLYASYICHLVSFPAMVWVIVIASSLLRHLQSSFYPLKFLQHFVFQSPHVQVTAFTFEFPTSFCNVLNITRYGNCTDRWRILSSLSCFAAFYYNHYWLRWDALCNQYCNCKWCHGLRFSSFAILELIFS